MPERKSENAETIVSAGKILQSLTPNRLATAFFPDSDIETQRELASILDCSPTTVSNHLKTLSKLPIPIVVKDGSNYEITPEGRKILALLSETTETFGVDLYNIDWDDESDISAVSECLDPLHTSSSPLIFFVLYSIGCRSSVGTQFNLLYSSKKLKKSDIVADVEQYQTVTSKQVWYRLDQFDTAGSIKFAGQEITLTDKGEEQIRLFEQILKFVKRHSEISRETTDPPAESSIADISQSAHEECQTGIVVNLDGDSTAASLNPAYCVDDEPMLTLSSSMTVEELAQKVGILGQELGADQTLDLQWTLQTDQQSDGLDQYKKLQQ